MPGEGVVQRRPSLNGNVWGLAGHVVESFREPAVSAIPHIDHSSSTFFSTVTTLRLPNAIPVG
jgi:hypothetical protein